MEYQRNLRAAPIKRRIAIVVCIAALTGLVAGWTVGYALGAHKAKEMKKAAGAVCVGGLGMNLETVTLEQCLDKYENKGEVTVIKAGEVLGFMEEGGKNA